MSSPRWNLSLRVSTNLSQKCATSWTDDSLATASATSATRLPSGAPWRTRVSPGSQPVTALGEKGGALALGAKRASKTTSMSGAFATGPLAP